MKRKAGSTKKCTKCGEVKSLDEFSKNRRTIDLKRCRCKECMNQAAEIYRKNNKNKLLKINRAWRKNNPEKHRLSYMNANKKRDYSKIKRRISPEKKSASNKLCKAIKAGIIIKPKNCEICKDADNIISGHHYNYTKPLSVIWLCSRCHTNYHLGKKEESTQIRKKVDELSRRRAKAVHQE